MVNCKREPEIDEVDPQVLLQIMQEEKILTEGSYSLSFNDDWENNWWFRREGESVTITQRFETVDYPGGDTFLLENDGVAQLTVKGLIDTCDQIPSVLMALAMNGGRVE
jgi:hypothetical protein